MPNKLTNLVSDLACKVFDDLPDAMADLWTEKDDPMTEPTTPIEPEVPAIRRTPCGHCRGTGLVPTTNELIRESLALFPTEQDQLDEFVREFYRRLLAAAPGLTRMFPPDLVNADHTALDSDGKAQRDRLLQAILTAVGEYDPDNTARMTALRVHLAAYGRSHRGFLRPGTGITAGAKMAEYVLVGEVLFELLHDVFPETWRPEYDTAWAEAYEHAAVMMLHAQWADVTPPAVARQPRRAGDETLRR